MQRAKKIADLQAHSVPLGGALVGLLFSYHFALTTDSGLFYSTKSTVDLVDLNVFCRALMPS